MCDQGGSVQSAPEFMGKRAIVLIVEDEPIVRFCAAEMLGGEGFEVLEAAGADQALDILESRGDVAILFTDIEMPGSMDGSALAILVQRRWPAIRIVVTSGRVRPTMDELPPLALFLPKPYMPHQLVAALLPKADAG